MNKIGWLVNDTLTCIPGTKTFWHDLLESIPNLKDKTNSYTDFAYLKEYIEKEWLNANLKPDYIIRNATFFGNLSVKTQTISLLQDCYNGDIRKKQIEVCNNSKITVFNSPFTKKNYDDLNTYSCIIPLGIDFDFFKPIKNIDNIFNIKENTILYIGSSDFKTKGFDKILKLIEETNFNFCLVLKDDFYINHPRVRLFNKIDHKNLINIINCCSMIICTSNIETQHLASLEAAACNIPILTTNVGTYFDLPDGEWGIKVKNNNFKDGIYYILNNIDSFNPRKYFISNGFDKKDCMKRWKELVLSL